LYFRGRGYDSDSHYYTLKLSDGTGLAFIGDAIYVDIDGPNKGKGEEGRDIFSFLIVSDRVGAPEYSYRESLPGDCKNEYQTGPACARWVLLYENVDYLHCDVTEEKPTCN